MDETSTAQAANQATVATPEVIEAEQDSIEILQPLPFHFEVIDRERLSLDPMFPIHAGQQFEPDEDLPPETFDVAKKEFKVWRQTSGNEIVFDGHHHFPLAKAAVYYVHSGVLKGRLVAVPKEVRCLVFLESEGWTADLIKKLSQEANFEGKKAIVVEPEEVTAARDSFEQSFEVVFDSICTDSKTIRILSRDSKNNEIRVRQRATRWDSVNENNRIYPFAVGEEARKVADAWARTGLMTSEFEHPNIVKDCSGNSCVDKFASNPRRQTAIVHRWHEPDADKWVDVERTIKGNTPYGKIVKDAIEKGQPVGLSTRFHLKGREKNINGRRVVVADHMDILTIDDVENPAVIGAGAYSPVTDSVLEFLAGDSETYALPFSTEQPRDGPYLGTPFFGINNNTANPEIDEEPELQKETDSRRSGVLEESHMIDIPRLINEFRAKYAQSGADSRQYAVDGINIVHEIAAQKKSGDCGWKANLDSFKAAFDSSTIQGYRGGAIQVTVASEMGGEVGEGWGSEIETATGLGKLVNRGGMEKPEPHGEGGAHTHSGPDADFIKKLRTDSEEKEEKEKKKEEFKKAAEDCEEMKAMDMDEAEMDSLKKGIRKLFMQTRPGTDAKAFLLANLSLVKKSTGDAATANRAQELIALHAKQNPNGDTTGKVLTGKGTEGDTQGSRARGANVTQEFVPWAAGTERFLNAVDSKCRQNRGALISGIEIPDPDAQATKQLRALNRNSETMRGVLEDHRAYRMGLARDNSEYKLATDSAEDEMKLMQKAVSPLLSIDPRSTPAVDTTTTAQVLNQPSIQEGQIVVGFQDLTALPFVMAMGPRGFNAASRTAGFEANPAMPFGTNLRIPSINYVNPSGYGYQDAIFDAGLEVGQNVGIPPGNITVAWLNFGVVPRKISCILTWEAIKQIGNGPGDISLLSWELYMMAARESRAIDNALYSEMVNVAYEFNCVPVSAESYAGAGNLINNNSQYNPGVAVVVNLNPGKKANAGVLAGDMSVTYPAAPPAAFQPIVAAVRLLAGGVNNNAAPFYGFYNQAPYPGTIGPGPIVRPRTVPTLSNAAGNTTNVTTNPVTITGMLVPAVQGEVAATGGIWSYPGTTATFAVDYENGTIVFPAGSVAGAANVISTSLTVSYSYATNWVDYVSDPALAAANNLIPVGQNAQQYQSLLMNTVDTVAAEMGTAGNYVKPDCALVNLIGSSQFTAAQIWAPLFSPPQTELFPNPMALGERSGVTFHRHNSSWVGRSQTLLLTRKGSTFYAQDTPFQIMGPVTVQDQNGYPTGNLSFYGQEFSVIGTRQPIDINNNVLQCPNKVIILRMYRQQLGVF